MNVRSLLRVAAISLAASMVLPQAASAQNRWVKVVNNSSYAIWYIYGTNTGNTNWGRDRLGGNILRPGYEVEINFNDGSGACRFDLKAETRYGRKVTNMDVNVCILETWTIDD